MIEFIFKTQSLNNTQPTLYNDIPVFPSLVNGIDGYNNYLGISLERNRIMEICEGKSGIVVRVNSSFEHCRHLANCIYFILSKETQTEINLVT